jgi:type II secretory pathway pseudopilin PulG
MRKALIIGIGLASLGALVQSAMAEEKENCETEYHACIRGAIELLYTVGGEAHDNGIQTCIALHAYCLDIAGDKPSKHARAKNGGGGNLKNFPGSGAGTTAGSFTKAGGVSPNGSMTTNTNASAGASVQKAPTSKRQNAVGNVLGGTGILGADRPKLHAN